MNESTNAESLHQIDNPPLPILKVRIQKPEKQKRKRELKFDDYSVLVRFASV